MNILILDSGIGGFSIYTQLRSALPNVNLSLLIDDGYFPYGTKPPVQLQKHFQDLAKNIKIFFHDIDILILGCNTASVYIDIFKSCLTCEVFSAIDYTFSNIKQNVQDSDEILLLQTRNTADSGIYERRLYSYYGDSVKVDSVISDYLIHQIENLEFYQSPDLSVQEILIRMAYEFHKAQWVVLGCTHFIYIKEMILELYPTIGILDPIEPLKEKIAQLSQDVKHEKQDCESTIFYTGTYQHIADIINNYNTYSVINKIDPKITRLNFNSDGEFKNF